jgi:hypothetical protein
LGKRRGIDPDEIERMVEETFGVELSSLTSGDAALSSEICSKLPDLPI